MTVASCMCINWLTEQHYFSFLVARAKQNEEEVSQGLIFAFSLTSEDQLNYTQTILNLIYCASLNTSND